MLRTAKVSVDIAMYSFTNREIAGELARLARAGIHVRVYRDRREVTRETDGDQSVVPLLLSAGVEVRVKSARDLMHLKSYLIDGTLLRTGSANWSPTGLKRQDNDLRYESDPAQAKLFQGRFTEMWDRPGNLVPAAEPRPAAKNVPAVQLTAVE